ncbi:MAG: hypothetical protein LBM25_00915 [Bacteroidales bacterium]|nr:hypothetical protein [Bacteroidales bacterium]
METKNRKDQFIIAFIENFEKSQQVIDYGIFFAQKLNKGLILLYVSDKKYNTLSIEKAEKELKKLNEQIKEDIFHSYCAIEGRTRDIVNKISELLSGVLLICSYCNEKPRNKKNKKRNYYKSLLNNLYLSRIAYFVFPENMEYKPIFNNVVLTLDNARECKEKVLWATYFGRFILSDITIYYHNYKDEFFRHQLHYNIKFTMKMLDNFNIKHSLHLSNDRKTYTDYQAMDYCIKNNCDTIICQTTKNRNLLNSLFGLKEEKLLEKNNEKPILFLNIRDDLFVLCD